MDTIIFRTIVSISQRYPLLDYLFIFFSEYLLILLIGVVIAGYIIYRTKDWSIIIYSSLISSVVARVVIKPIILLIYQRPRPFIVLEDFSPISRIPFGESMMSFPSGHALIAFAIAGSVFAVNKRLGTFFLICATLIGFSRIYVGLHWPSDVLMGAILGLLVGYLISRLYKHLLYK